MKREAISIIVPAFNEEAGIADTLRTLAEAGAREILVADGGSRDRTVERARAVPGARVVEGARANRGAQMNEGARAASGEALWFLHADVRLPAGALAAIAEAMADPRIAGGCFQLRFPADVPASLRAVAWGINLRTRMFRTATGDQGIFVRREVFDSIGGYQPLPLMEDIALFREMKRRGRVVVLEGRIEISPRRWLTHGIWRTVLLMYLLRLGFWLGISPATLKRYFVDTR